MSGFLSVKVTGGGLTELISRLNGLQGARFVEEVAQQAAPAIGKLVAREFAQGKGPYGERWAKPKAGNKPGVRSGALRSVSRADAVARTILVSAYVDHASFFDRSRGLLPGGKGGVPPAWKAAIQKAAERVLERRLRGTR